jgi:hypothetical protein
MLRKYHSGALGHIQIIFHSTKGNKPAPKTPQEAIDKLKQSPWYCKDCRARFLTMEALDAHKEERHVIVKKGKWPKFEKENGE